VCAVRHSWAAVTLLLPLPTKTRRAVGDSQAGNARAPSACPGDALGEASADVAEAPSRAKLLRVGLPE
jgi:hypothetical protein